MKKNSLFKSILILFLAYVLLSWIIPTGYFNNGEFVKDSITSIGLFDIIIYPIVTATSSVFILTAIIFILIGGFYGILNKTGAYSIILEKLMKKLKGNEKISLIVITLTFIILASLTNLSLPLFVLVPFASTLLILLGYNKFTAMLSTVGGILAGNMASTYGFNITGYISYLTENINDSIWIRLIMLVLVAIAFVMILLNVSKLSKSKNKNEDIPLYEKNVIKGKSIKPLIIVSVLTFIVIMIGMFNWNGVFGIELFENLYTSVINFKIGNYAIFTNLLGSLRAVGSWTNYELGLVLIINGFIIGRLYQLKCKDILDGFLDGAKKMIPVALWTMVASIIFLLMNTNSNGYTIYNTITNSILGLTNNLNVVTISLTSFIGSILYNDFPYLLSILYAPITALYTNYSLIGMIVQIIHGLVQFIAPTSVILVAGLTYFKIPYTEWLKKIWKLFLCLLAIGIIAIIIMLIIA